MVVEIQFRNSEGNWKRIYRLYFYHAKYYHTLF